MNILKALEFFSEFRPTVDFEFWIVCKAVSVSFFCFYCSRPEANYNALSKSRLTKPWWHRLQQKLWNLRTFCLLRCFVFVFTLLWVRSSFLALMCPPHSSLKIKGKRDQSRQGDRQIGLGSSSHSSICTE